jgi:5-methylcytosine-specific restriction endonuclease McrA
MTTYAFRDNRPKHRKNRKVCKDYKSYKKTLRIDFLHRCGYCNDLDHNRIRSYVIDHFIPRNPDGWTHRIQPNKYYNLVYSCPFCNGAKSNKWPTKKTKIHNDGVVGFIMPTKKAYDSIFYRKADGSIDYPSGDALAKHIYEELGLFQPIHSLNWRFQKYLTQEATLESIYNKTKDPVLKQEIQDLRSLRLEMYDNINTIYNAA